MELNEIDIYINDVIKKHLYLKRICIEEKKILGLLMKKNMNIEAI